VIVRLSAADAAHPVAGGRSMKVGTVRVGKQDCRGRTG
jgi:hypothetical protein